MAEFLPVITIKATLAGFAALGMDPDALLAPTGLTPAQLDDPFGAAPVAAHDQLWVQAFLRDPEPTLPTRAAMAVPFGAFGLVDHLVSQSASIGEGLQMLALSLRLVANNLALTFDHRDGDWVTVINDPCEASVVVTEQWTLAVIFERFRTRMAAFKIEEVHLPLPERTDPAPFAALWGVPVVMGRPHAAMRLAPGVWATPNPDTDPALRATLALLAERVEIKQFDHAPLAYAIRTRLPEALQSQRFSADAIAAELGLSRRTLHRHLAAENITFQELLDLHRQEQAVQMLQSGAYAMSEIAYALGYNEQSSFNRAFRRWTGTSPSAWRRPQLGSGQGNAP